MRRLGLRARLHYLDEFPPGWVPVVRGVVGESDRFIVRQSKEPSKEATATPTGVDGVDLVVTVTVGEQGVPARVGYLLAVRRVVGTVFVVHSVVGELDLTPSAGVDGVNLVAWSLPAFVGYPLAIG
jgi:hypothetical protein